MVVNVWLDRQDAVLYYNIKDLQHGFLTAGCGVDKSSALQLS